MISVLVVDDSVVVRRLIVDALTEGDAEKAVLSVRNHVIVQGERFADLVSSLSRLDAPPDRTEPQTGLAPAI